MIALSLQQAAGRWIRAVSFLATLALIVMAAKPAASLPASVIASRYQHDWNLLSMPEWRVVRTRMTVNHMFTPGSTYNSSYTSVLDDYPNKQLRNMRVTSSGNDLTWSTFDRDGFLFVEWWFDEPLVGGAVSATTVMEYDIYNGVMGCSNRSADRWWHFKGMVEKAPDDGNVVCRESFSAGWANEWSSPVRRVQYTFALPSLQGLNDDSWYVAPPSIDTSSPSQNTTLTLDNAPSCCYFTSSNEINDLSSSQTLSCQCTELDADENADTRAKKIVFQWQLVNPTESIYHCTKTCGVDVEAARKNKLVIWLMIWFLALVVVYVTLTAIEVILTRKKIRQQEQQSEMDRPKPAAEQPNDALPQDSASLELNTTPDSPDGTNTTTEDPRNADGSKDVL